MNARRKPLLLALGLVGGLALLPFAATVLSTTLGAQPAPSRWVAFEALAEADRLLVVSWLAEDCEAGERFRRLTEITLAGVRLAPVFQEAFTLGPPPRRLDESRANAKTAYEQRQAWLRSDGEKLFGAEETQRLLAETPESYTERQVETVDRGWRERALIALGRLGDDKTLSDLKKMAADANDSYAATAKRALEERDEKPQE